MIALMIQNPQSMSLPMSMVLVLFLIAPLGVALIARSYQWRPALTRRLVCALIVALALSVAINRTVSAFYIQCYWFMVECWF